MQITIDCVPYKVVEFNNGNGLTIIDISNSVLGLLDNRTHITGNRFSDDHEHSVLWQEEGDKYHHLDVTFEDDGAGCLNINIDGFSFDGDKLNLLAEWIEGIFNAAESIGYEALYTREHIEKYF